MKNSKPVVLNEEETTAFIEYARDHYRFMVTEAITIAESIQEIRGEADIHEWARTVFDKIATPRVFLIERFLEERNKKAWEEAAK